MRSRASVTGLARRAGAVRWQLLDAAGGVGRRVPAGLVALTFDDGPHPGSTTRVLEELARLGVHATFFCVGQNAHRHPDLVRRIRAEGHAVGSHSNTHPHPARTPLPALASEYRDGRRVLAEVLGQDTSLFRPPHGHLSVTNAVLLRQQGLRPWLWTVDPEDWRPGSRVDHVASVAGRAGSGDVVLLHDWVEQPEDDSALDRSATIEALPEIVDQVRSRGLGFTALTP